MIDIYDADGKPESRGDRTDGLRDKFQGAVMGLWMAPTALHSDGLHFETLRNSGADLGLSVFSDAIARYLSQIDAFLQSPRSFDSSEISSDSALSSLPVLLRYHGDSARRCRAVFEFALGRESQRNAQLLAQQLILGDILSIALSGFRQYSKSSLETGSQLLDRLLKTFPTTAALKSRASDCRLSTLQHRCYQDLWQSLRSQVIQGSMTAGDAVTDGIAIALTQLDNYSAAVQQAQSAYASGCTSSRSNRVDAKGVDSVLVTSVVAGALGGRKSLPVLWQLEPNMKQPGSERSSVEPDCIRQNYSYQRMRRNQVIDMANRLFDQWAGIARKSRTIIAK